MAKTKKDLATVEHEVFAFFAQGAASTVRKEPKESWSDPTELAMISARHWGVWVMPEDEDDDGDYDWEILAPHSRDKLRQFEKDLAEGFDEYKFRVATEEKNWISVSIRLKT